MHLRVPTHIIEHVQPHMDRIRKSGRRDKPWWTKTSSQFFIVKSAWDLVRKREEELDCLKKIWV